MVLLALLLYRRHKHKHEALRLPEDPDARVVENNAFENPQYAPAAGMPAGSRQRIPSTSELRQFNATAAARGRDQKGGVPAGHVEYSIPAEQGGGGPGSAGGSSAQLYAVPMEAASEGAHPNNMALPRSRSGTVVAAASSGNYEVVAATDGIYAAADAQAHGIHVIPAADAVGYHHLGELNRAGAGAGAGAASVAPSAHDQPGDIIYFANTNTVYDKLAVRPTQVYSYSRKNGGGNSAGQPEYAVVATEHAHAGAPRHQQQGGGGGGGGGGGRTVAVAR